MRRMASTTVCPLSPPCTSPAPSRRPQPPLARNMPPCAAPAPLAPTPGFHTVRRGLHQLDEFGILHPFARLRKVDLHAVSRKCRLHEHNAAIGQTSNALATHRQAVNGNQN